MTSPQELQAELRDKIEMGLMMMFDNVHGEPTLWVKNGIDALMRVIESERKKAVEAYQQRVMNPHPDDRESLRKYFKDNGLCQWCGGDWSGAGYCEICGAKAKTPTENKILSELFPN